MNLITRFIKLTKGEPQKAKKSPKWDITEDRFLQFSEIQTLCNYCHTLRKAGLRERNLVKIRNWFMIELALHTGLRVAEMKNLKIGNLLIENGKTTLFTVGKGNKPRPIKLSVVFITTCFYYLDLLQQLGFSTASDAPLLPRQNGRHLSKRTLQKNCSQIFKEAGLPSYYHIHSLRHTYATFLLIASNYNYRLVQKQLGHSSIKTTQTYAGVLDQELKHAVNNLYKSNKLTGGG